MKTIGTVHSSGIRHLAWLCEAPQLLTSPITFDLAAHMPATAPIALKQWDQHPGQRPVALTDPPHPRLGLYFERLYECVLTDLLGWELLAKNVQVRDGAGRTIGELDFLVRNGDTGQVEHHEIAVKFYLGYTSTGLDDTLWYGPNSRDRLDLKSSALLQRQSRLAERPETRAILNEWGVNEPIVPRIFMPGYLFYPDEPSVAVPASVPTDHLRGRWLYLEQTRLMDTSSWVPLVKPQWLGPWEQPQRPDPAVATEALAALARTGRPGLFARLAEDPVSGRWQEYERLFTVPAHWPEHNGK